MDSQAAKAEQRGECLSFRRHKKWRQKSECRSKSKLLLAKLSHSHPGGLCKRIIQSHLSCVSQDRMEYSEVRWTANLRQRGSLLSVEFIRIEEQRTYGVNLKKRATNPDEVPDVQWK